LLADTYSNIPDTPICVVLCLLHLIGAGVQGLIYFTVTSRFLYLKPRVVQVSAWTRLLMALKAEAKRFHSKRVTLSSESITVFQSEDSTVAFTALHVLSMGFASSAGGACW
jgi:hypothetical protein